jgi:uncharacterized membrane protein
MNDTDLAVAVYNTHLQAETGVKTLQRSGFEMTKISIIGRDYESEEQVLGYFNTGERMKFFGKLGAFWGALAGVLFGAAFMLVPVVGQVVILGPLAATIVSGLEGAVFAGAAGALAGALTAIGIPKDSVVRYDTALKANKFLLVVHGDAQEIQRAREILEGTDVASFDAHYFSSATASAAAKEPAQQSPAATA